MNAQQNRSLNQLAVHSLVATFAWAFISAVPIPLAEGQVMKTNKPNTSKSERKLNLITKTVKIGDVLISAKSSPELAEQATGLLEYIRTTYADTPSLLCDGLRVPFGGTALLRLKGQAARLQLYEPDFETDPLSNWREDISTSLKIQQDQLRFLNSCGVKSNQAVQARCQDKVVFLKGCLQKDRIYLERTKTKIGDSGWYIGSADRAKRSKPTVNDLAACYVADLVRIRPDVMQVLALPPGFLVVFHGSKIEGVQLLMDN